MKDGYNREISYMRLSVTDKCNFQCAYCTDATNCSRKITKLSLDEMYDICTAAVKCGVSKIRITGGEPLIREGLVEFCARVRSIQGLRKLALTTNGSLLEEYAEKLKNSGVDSVNISLDTLKHDRFKEITGTDKLDDVLCGIKAAQEVGFSTVKINVVLMGGINDDEIRDFVELTKDNDISVRFIELMPIGACAIWDRSRFVSVEKVLVSVPELIRTSFDGVAETYRIEGYKGTVGLIRPISNKFCSMCNRIRVTCDGMLKTCLHSNDEYKLRNLNEKQLVEQIRYAINNKPISHNLSETCFSEAQRYMNQIGG